MHMAGSISTGPGPGLDSVPSSQPDKKSGATSAADGRLASLDFFRGLTMFMLIGETTRLYELLRAPELNGTLLSHVGRQLDHHPWNGLHCWDLVQPFFMFIVGVARRSCRWKSAGIPFKWESMHCDEEAIRGPASK
jgi:hypothetical protein